MRKPVIVTPQTPLEDLPQFLTVEEWRTFMRIGRSSAYDLIRQGLVPVVRWGRTLRIPRGAVWKFVNQDGLIENGVTLGDQPRMAQDTSARGQARNDGAET